MRALGRNALLAAAALLAPVLAEAQVFRAYLASTGNDANACSLAAPCRLLPAALNAVASGGEIWMLDSGNFNTSLVTISKSVNILAVPGAVASLVATLGNSALAITTPGIKVTLRNLVIAPVAGTSSFNGITANADMTLEVDHCLIGGMQGIGISFSAGVLRVRDSIVRGNTGGGIFLASGARGVIARSTVAGNTGSGIFASNDSVAVPTTLDVLDTLVEGNLQGVVAAPNVAGATVRASVRDSRIVRNVANGIIAQALVAGPVVLTASNNLVHGNGGNGIFASGPTTKIYASGNTVTSNLFGLTSDGPALETGGDNSVRNNGTDISAPINIITRQ